MIGENTCLGAGIRVHLLRWGRHQIETILTTKNRWKSERKFRKDLRKVSPDILVDLRFSNFLEELLFFLLLRKEDLRILYRQNPILFFLH